MIKYSQYTIIARLFPAFITALPLLVLYYFYLSLFLSDFLQSFISVKFLGEFTILAAIIFLYSQFNRFVGKIIEDLIFCDENQMPITQLLLCSDKKYSLELKHEVHKKIKKDFNLTLFDLDDELNDERSARTKIVEAVALIRTKTRKSELLFQHNYEYGFIRNLVGGSLFGLVISLVNLIVFSRLFHNTTAFNLSIASSVSFFVLICIGVPLIKYMGYKYAKVLLHEYLTVKNE